jgi:hypothetical protein
LKIEHRGKAKHSIALDCKSIEAASELTVYGADTLNKESPEKLPHRADSMAAILAEASPLLAAV